jgi:hypothetical protein
MTLLRGIPLGELDQDQLKESSKWTFNRFKKIFDSMNPSEHGDVRREIKFLNGYQLKAKRFTGGIENAQRIRFGVFNGEKEALSFTVSEEAGIPSIDLKGVGLVVGNKNLGSSDHGTLSFFSKDKTSAIQLGEEIVKRIEGSYVTGSLEFLGVELKNLLLPKNI